MNKFRFTALLLLLAWTTSEAQIDIANARSMSEGSTVTIKGIATNGAEQGIIRYIQDDTGGLPAYPGTGSVGDFPDDVRRGDLVEVTGVIKSFNGLLEIDPITAYNVESRDNALPEPKLITPDQLNESNEGLLVRLENVRFKNGGGIFSGGVYEFEAAGESGVIFLRTNHGLIGTNIPLANVNLTGLASEFNGNHQLLPRDASDLEIADDFFITSSLRQSDIAKDGFTISWNTNTTGTSNLRYGTDPSNLDIDLTVGGSNTSHSISLSGLDPAKIYYVQAYSDNGSTTINSGVEVFSTASNSNGFIEIYFNYQVDGSFSNGAYADDYTPIALEAAIIDRIRAAQSTIDVSVYNTNRNPIINALTEAYNRGVQVRFVTDNETSNLALQELMPPFPVVRGNAEGLMHNKFFVIDAESETNSWVIMGSTNMTQQNIGEDPNNTIHIQDQALARAYTIEFEELWGADGAEPGIFNVRFGAQKARNTPRLFVIGGVPVESYFSPTDNTTVGITQALATAEEDVEFALLTFTNNELGAAIIDAHRDDVDVRGIIENINDQGGEFDFLQSNGVNVIDDTGSRQLHHKYCIIDATAPDSDPMVVTGSHNWSGGAETRNDENTLIFHSASMANIFLQEFEARWCEAQGGGNSCVTSTEAVEGIEGFTATISPNPAVDVAVIDLNLDRRADLVIRLLDLNGRTLQAKLLGGTEGHLTERLSLGALPAGTYLVSFEVEGKSVVRKLQVLP
ncbi:MAG: phospholipase D-like domain-containing protein [Bacteroidota bacterium]